MGNIAESLKRLIFGNKNKNKNEMKCQLCDRTFATKEDLDNHTTTAHK